MLCFWTTMSLAYRIHLQPTWLLLQNDDFWKSCLGVKWLWGSDFLDFLLPKTCPHMGHLTGVNFFLISQSPSQRSLHYQDRSMSLGPVSSIDLTITTKWWLLKIVFGCKMTLEVRFFEFFTSRNIPPYGASHGCKFFLISQSRLDMCLLEGIHVSDNCGWYVTK